MPTPLQGIKACIFDAYGTLFDINTPMLRALAALDDRAEPFVLRWRDKQLQYAWLRSLMGVHADFWQVTSEALDHTMELYGIQDPALHQKLMDLYLQLDSFEDAGTCLGALQRRGMRLAMLSNGSPAMLDAVTKASGLAGYF
jgi:2-haloacid dehalogenase